MSIHISASVGDIADAILLPGDPLRAKFIAETYLKDAVCFNQVRGMLGFTGTYQGKRVSVMGTGMGQPSLSIYVNELIRDYCVKTLVRVGTCGGITDKVKVRDLILGLSASTDSAVNKQRFRGMDYAAAPDFLLLKKAYETAVERKIPVHVGKIVTSDSFYTPDPEGWKLWAQYGCIGIEMETAELYTLAAQYGARALTVLTVSDHLVTHEETTSEERQLSFGKMVEVGFAAALS
ncbi:MAG: purine-nucleoside phosphorylase [Spirochaetales bacterium]